MPNLAWLVLAGIVFIVLVVWNATRPEKSTVPDEGTAVPIWVPLRSEGFTELTAFERQFMTENPWTCPDCWTGPLMQGPEAGSLVNARCTSCGAEFNFGGVGGHIGYAERIGLPERAVLTAPNRVARAVRNLLRAMTAEDRDLVSQWIAIPNTPDASAYVFGLQSRLGAVKVRRASNLVEAMRRGLNVRYDDIQPVIQAELGVKELV